MPIRPKDLARFASAPDRIHTLFGSKVFQEPLEDIGEPLFWAPLIARHQGLRMEECLQLGPDDFGSDKGIPYLKVSKTIINGLKTLSSERTMVLRGGRPMPGMSASPS